MNKLTNFINKIANKITKEIAIALAIGFVVGSLLTSIVFLCWPKSIESAEIPEEPNIEHISEPLESSVIDSEMEEIEISRIIDEEPVEEEKEPEKVEDKKEEVKIEIVKEEKEPEKIEEKKEEIKTETVKEEPKEEVVESSDGRTFSAIVTHYCACSKCNGNYSWSEGGVNYTATASGITLHDGIDGNYCAATFGNLGDIVTINGVDYKIVDRMGGNDGKRIDIFVADGHARCNELGRYTANVILHD